MAVLSLAAYFVFSDVRNRPQTGPTPGMSHPLIQPLKSIKDPRLARLDGEDDMDFSKRLNQIVSQSFYHCDPDDATRIVDRIALHLLSGNYRAEGFLDPKSARCGFCHQSAFILSYALERWGVNSIVFGLNGHVVSLVKIDDQHYLFDPDYGVGPIPYPNYTSLTVKNSYQKSGLWNPSLIPVYATTRDDQPYMSMDWLKHARIHQQKMVFRVESIVILILSLSIIVFLGAVIRNFLNSSVRAYD